MFAVSSGLVNYLGSRYMAYDCGYLFFAIKGGRENHQINTSQTLINVLTVIMGSHCLCVAFNCTISIVAWTNTCILLCSMLEVHV